MPSSFTTSLRLVKQAAGENVTTWGTIFNQQFSDLIDRAIAGYASIALADANKTLTVVNGASDEARQAVLNFTGALTAVRTITIPPVSKTYFIRNNTTGGFGLTFKTASGASVTVPAATNLGIICDGTDTFFMTNGVPPSATIDGLSIGYLEIPQNSKSADYTLVASDSGKHIYHPSSDASVRTWTIPSNASVPFRLGTAITFINGPTAGNVILSITSDTLSFAGTGGTGNRLLAGPASVTAVKVEPTVWVISGSGMT